jgi:threonine/homoserine/homoserine lactone efflux protein
MPPIANYLAFVGTAIVVVVIPGPSVLFVIGRALSLGRAGALLSVVGNAIGLLLQVLAVSLGLGVVIEESAVVFMVVKFAGAAFLIYLGIQAIRHRKNAMVQEDVVASGPFKVLLEGGLVGVSNPKSIVFLLAVLPQFVALPAGGVAFQLFVLGATFALIALVLDSVWAVSASAARNWFARSPKRIESLGAAGGVVMIGLGAVVALASAEG